MEIDPSLVVLGDVLRLEPGDQVVVDGPMVGEGRMEVDESLLTGESDLVTKHPGDELMSGSFCMTGGGYYEAAQVGLDSFANKLTAKATAYKRELTPLQRQVVQIVRVLLIVVIVFEILVWVRNVAGGVPFVESVRMSTVILALIPNGLVLSIALTYALGAVRLLGKDVLVQQFNAVESLSNVDVLCTDKTGTLTSGVVTFEELAGLGADDARAARLLGAFAASTTDANRTIEALRTAFPAERLPAAHEAFFSSDRKWSGLAFADGEARGTYVLGAPEVLAPALGAGADWRAQADAWTARGLRVVLFAGADEPAAFSDEPDAPPVLPAGLEALALICFSDELRPGVRGTLEEFSEAGIDVKIISGDNPKTVVALATQAGVQSLRRRVGVDSYCDMVVADATAAAPGAATQAGDAQADAGSRPRRSRRGRAARARAGRRLRRRARRALAGGLRRQGRRGRHLRPRHARAEAGPRRGPARPRALRRDDRRRRQRRHRAQAGQRRRRHAGRQPGGAQRRRPHPHEGHLRAAPLRLPRGPADHQRHERHPAHLHGAHLLQGGDDRHRHDHRRVPVRAAPVGAALVLRRRPCRPSPSRCGRSRARRPRSGCSSCSRASCCPPSSS